MTSSQPRSASPNKTVCILLQSHYEIDIRVKRKVEALLSAGYDIDVLALRSSFSKAKNYTVDGVNVYTIGLGRKRGSLARYAFEYIAFFLWVVFKLPGLMKRRNYSIIDVNNLPDFLVFAAAYAKRKGAKVVFDMHEITPEFYMSKYRMKENSLLVRFLKWVERKSMRFADHVITINHPIQQLLETRGLDASKSTIIMNCVDEEFFAGAANSRIARGSETKRPRFVMMYHGTLTHIYGLDLAIQAFGQVQKQMADAELWILGGGTQKPQLEELALRLGVGDKVKLLGTVLPEEIPAWLNQCDVGVLATRQDTFLDLSFSSKLSEYIITGKPVIASRLKTIRYYFSEEALAYFTPEDTGALAQQMLNLYQDEARRTRLTRQAKREFEPIRWELMKERYLKMMADTITGSAATVRQGAKAPRLGGEVLSR